MKFGCSVITCLVVFGLLCSVESRLRPDPLFQWSQLDFDFPPGIRAEAITNGSFIPQNNNILATATWGDKVFTTVFRWGKGVASSLNYVLQSSGIKSPVLIPYPSFWDNYVNEDPTNQTTTLASDKSIISVGHIKVDRCDRLWAVDMGVSEFFGTVRQIAPPAIVIFDLKTDTLIRRFVLPAAFIKSDSLYANIEVDFEGQDCANAFAYAPDMRGLVVYSFALNTAWRLEHNYFGPEPSQGNLFYEKINYHWNFGIFGTAMGKLRTDGTRRLYFNPLVSRLNNYYYDVKYLGKRGNSKGQTKTIAYDETTSVLFQTQFEKDSITCWKSTESYKKSHIEKVYKNEVHFFAGDVNIDAERNLWFLGNRLPLFFYGTWDITAPDNIRIWKVNIDTLIKGTRCAEDDSFF